MIKTLYLVIILEVSLILKSDSRLACRDVSLNFKLSFPGLVIILKKTPVQWKKCSVSLKLYRIFKHILCSIIYNPYKQNHDSPGISIVIYSITRIFIYIPRDIEI